MRSPDFLDVASHPEIRFKDYGVAWTHPAVPLFVSDEIRIDIRLISKQHDREPAEEDAN